MCDKAAGARPGKLAWRWCRDKHTEIPAPLRGGCAAVHHSAAQHQLSSCRVRCLFMVLLLAGQEREGNTLNVMTGASLWSPSATLQTLLGQGDPLPTSPGMVVRWGEESTSSHPRAEAALSSSCCQLTGQTESCYCKDRDHTGPHACPCRKVPWGHLSDTRPASGAGAKGSPPGAVWLGRPALNC